MSARHRIMLIVLCAVGAAPAGAQEWDGGVVGVTAEHDWTRSESQFTSILALPIGPLPTGRFSDRDVSLGGVAGYRWQTGALVLGGEADAAISLGGGGAGPAPYYAVDPQWHGSLRAVAGVSLDRALVFATVGAAKGRFEFRHDPGVPLTRVTHRESPTGLVLGGGIEFAAGRIHPRLEYRHVRYQRTSTLVGAISYHDRVTADSLRLNLLYRF
jgi:opacity protein-like surface antigen